MKQLIIVLASMLSFDSFATSYGDIFTTSKGWYGKYHVGHTFFDKDRMLSADMSLPIEWCKSESNYYCVKGSFLFAIPKDGKFADEWEFEGIQYNLIDAKHKFDLLGTEYTVKLIWRSYKRKDEQGKEKEYKMEYLFSDELGLLGWQDSTREDDLQSFYVLKGNCGLFAPDSCIKVNK